MEQYYVHLILNFLKSQVKYIVRYISIILTYYMNSFHMVGIGEI